MKLDKYNKLKLKLEVFKLEQNYMTLDKILYYFSFLGNIFLIYFGYFFVKSITNSIPPLFPFQEIFFTIFIALFLTGYELTKRFTLEQFFTGVLQVKKLTTNIFIGGTICSLLIAGSFYLSIKGAHRLVDTSGTMMTKTDSTITLKQDSIAKYYDKEILYYRSESGRNREDKRYRDSIVNTLQQTKESKINEVEKKIINKSSSETSLVQENSTAFLFITIFLELIVLIGVGFDAFYTLGSFEETKKLLQTPKFRQLELNLKLLKLFYQNGRKKEQDSTLSKSKLIALVSTSKIPCNQTDINNFIVLCSELEITSGNKRSKIYNMNYEKAKELLENQEL
jgi:hypothetical protein